MSWQRILETARRRGIPLIVTDIAGREPMVILPFDDYEQMGEPRLKAQNSKLQAINEEFADFEAEELQEQVDEVMTGMAGEPSDDSGLSIEEKFYLEPVDDEAKS